MVHVFPYHCVDGDKASAINECIVGQIFVSVHDLVLGRVDVIRISPALEDLSLPQRLWKRSVSEVGADLYELVSALAAFIIAVLLVEADLDRYILPVGVYRDILAPPVRVRCGQYVTAAIFFRGKPDELESDP